MNGESLKHGVGSFTEHNEPEDKSYKLKADGTPHPWTSMLLSGSYATSRIPGAVRCPARKLHPGTRMLPDLYVIHEIVPHGRL